MDLELCGKVWTGDSEFSNHKFISGGLVYDSVGI
jgi:hypothetical protein